MQIYERIEIVGCDARTEPGGGAPAEFGREILLCVLRPLVLLAGLSVLTNVPLTAEIDYTKAIAALSLASALSHLLLRWRGSGNDGDGSKHPSCSNEHVVTCRQAAAGSGERGAPGRPVQPSSPGAFRSQSLCWQ